MGRVGIGFGVEKVWEVTVIQKFCVKKTVLQIFGVVQIHFLNDVVYFIQG